MKRLEDIISILLISINVNAQQKSVINPLLAHSNSPINYNSITTGTLVNLPQVLIIKYKTP